MLSSLTMHLALMHPASAVRTQEQTKISSFFFNLCYTFTLTCKLSFLLCKVYQESNNQQEILQNESLFQNCLRALKPDNVTSTEVFFFSTLVLIVVLTYLHTSGGVKSQ